MKKLILLSVLILGLIQNAFTQKSTFNSPLFECGSDQINRRNSEFSEKLQFINDQILNHNADADRSNLVNPPPYLLPVVVHVIHENGVENISDQQIEQGIQDLNQAFENVDYYDQGTGVNTQIQFCLAQRDVEGNATSGINRIESSFTNLNMNTQDFQMKQLIQWDPLSYINIWLVKEICTSPTSCGVAGYAYYPSAHGASIDGIVQEARWFGSTNSNSAVQVHEMGHYLGLYHTFQGGCGNNDCQTSGDRVCDTPPDNSTIAVPCNGNVNSCDTDTDSGFATNQNDMFWNYMDYGDFDCYSAFTQGQQERMHAVIEGVRQSLLSSNGCNDPCLSQITANFLPIADQTIGVGSTLNFTNTTTNATNYDWQIGGISFASTLNSNYTFNEEGTYIISLEASNGDVNCFDDFSIEVTVVCAIDASFQSSNGYPEPGEIVTYENQSSGATDYVWTVDGETVGVDEDLDYSFSQFGIYTVCLEAGNDFCSASFCQVVFANVQTTSDCEDTFIQSIGTSTLEEKGRKILITPDNNILIGGARGDSTLLILMDENENIMWERTFKFVDLEEHIQDMIIDADGFLVGVGRTAHLSTKESYYFKYDYLNNQIIWAKELVSNSLSRISAYSIDQSNVDGNYYISGETLTNTNGCDAILLEVDKTTGNSLWNNSYNLGSCEFFFKVLSVSNSIYTFGRNTYPGFGGLNGFRGSISKFDQIGDQQWSKMYHVDENENALLYFEDAIIDNGIVITGYGDLNGTQVNNYKSSITKTDFDGNIIWANIYQISSNNEREYAEKILNLPNGYLITGRYRENNVRNIFLMKTDKVGNVLWTKSIGGNQDDLGYDIAIKNGFIFLLGETSTYGLNNSKSIFLGKFDFEGNILDDCIEIVDLNIIAETITNPYQGTHDLTQYATDMTDVQINPSAQETHLEINSICFEPCIPIDNCEDTFIQSIGTEDQDELGRVIISEPNGGFIIGGAKKDSTLLVLLDSNAEVVWERSFKFLGLNEKVRDLIIDSEGFLVGIGFTDYTGPTDLRESYVFKYDYINDNMIWAREISSPNEYRISLFSIVELENNGNYIIGGEVFPSTNGCDGTLLEINKNTGLIEWNKKYDVGTCEMFYDVIIVSNSIYTFGRNDLSNGIPGYRSAINKFDINGVELWSKSYIVPPNETARLYNFNAIEDNGFLNIGYGNLSGTNGSGYKTQIFKTDYNGNLIWSKHYTLSSNVEYALGAINLPDGYLITGRYLLNGIANMYLMKINKEGDVLWTKSIGDNDFDTGYDLLFQNGYIYIIGESKSYGFAGSKDLLLMKLTLEGESLNSCDAINNLDIQGVNHINPYEATNIMDEYAGDLISQMTLGTSLETSLEKMYVCFDPCTPIDTCAILSDGLIHKPQISCNNGEMTIQFEICNLGNQIIGAEMPFVIYDDSPYDSPAIAIYDAFIGVDLLKDSCIVKTISIPSIINQYLYFLLNIDPTTPTPFDLNTLLPNTGIEECVYENNIDSIILNHTLLPLDIGEDLTMCDNATLTFDAGTGFISYQWSDNTTEQFTTVFGEGLYWVEVIDECGIIQRDSVIVSIAPQTELVLPDDITMCVGELQISVEGFENYQWFPSELVDCDTCDNVIIDIDQTIEIIAIGNNPPGCYSADTIIITVADSLEFTDTAFICFGESATIFGQEETVEGWYTQTTNSSTGCDTTFNVYLDVNPEIVLDFDVTPEVAGLSNGSAEVSVVGGTPDYLYNWSNNQETLNLIDVSTGDYILTVTDSNDCTKEITVTIPAIEKIEIEFPNIFSPNGDNLNDDFGPKEINYPIEEYTLEVFDRWGSKIFESNDIDIRWNGKNKDVDVPAEVYIYAVHYKDVGGEMMLIYGDVTVVR